MAKDLFNRYIWLVDTIYRANGITFEEINEKWLMNSMSDGVDIPLKTFHNHRHAIEDIFDINIVCDKKGGYKYYIENADDMEKGGIRTWTPVIEAMRDSLSVEIKYKSFWRQDEYTAEVEPYFVKVFKQRWYLIARNKIKDATRIYALDRIQALTQTGNTFVMPKDFSPEEYFYNCFGIIHDDNCPSETVELKVYGIQREYFRTLPLHHSQEETETEKDYSVFRYYLSPTYDFVQEILSHGCEVEVLSPGHLRDEIRKHAEVIAGRV